MRLTPDELVNITGLTQPSAQARWFKTYFNIIVPVDPRGPIMTAAIFETLLARECGVPAKARVHRDINYKPVKPAATQATPCVNVKPIRE